MRKYRAWDMKDKRMINWRELLDYGSGLAEYLLNPRELIFCEFTGLKDVNDKEVYENDIVEEGDNYPSVVEWCQKDEGIEGTGWMLHEYYPRRGRYAGKSDRYHVTTAYTNGLTVIGNIYQNPKLLRRLR